MRTSLIATVLGVALAAGAAANDDDDHNEEVSTGDVLAVLEEINQKLDHDRSFRSDGDPDSGYGGGPFMPVRYLPGIADLNVYLKKLGSYAPMNPFFFPFKDGGAGTLRWVFDRSVQFGMEYGGFGQDVLGFATHASDPLGPRDTVDADGDGYDDYHSYAGYGQHYFAGIFQYKVPIAPRLLYLTTGIKTGLAFESMRYGKDRRQVLTETLGITSGGNSWKRTSLLGGVYAGLQVRLDGDRNVLKLGIEAGVTGHYAISAWAPAAGVHKRTPAPPDAVQAHNFWLAIGPQFNY